MPRSTPHAPTARSTAARRVSLLALAGTLAALLSCTPLPHPSADYGNAPAARAAPANPPVTPDRASVLGRDAAATETPLIPAQYAARLAGARSALHRAVPGRNLVEHLYLDWLFDPYHRATLAIALKTLTVLEHDLALRQAGSELLSDAQARQALDWLEAAANASPRPVPADFEPARCRISAAAWLAAPGPAPEPWPPALFAFADRSTMSQCDHLFGDFDLLASLGQRVYAVGRNRPLEPNDVEALRAHAQALGIELVDAPLPLTETPASPGLTIISARVRPHSLSQFARGMVSAAPLPAVVDPPAGESWAGLLARRALSRGVTGRCWCVAVGCVPPAGSQANLPDRTAAALWVAALDGQRLGVLEGWRDVRDGTDTPYPARMADPASLQAGAHAALDILRHGDLISRLQGGRDAGFTLDDSWLDDDDPNAWSPIGLAALEQIVEAQVTFDLRPAARSHAATVQSGDAPTAEPTLSPEEGEIASVLADIRDNPLTHPRWTVRELDGTLARDLYVRSSAGHDLVAVVNLTDTERELTLRHTRPEAASRTVVDALCGQRISGAMRLGPYQIRILRVEGGKLFIWVPV